MYTSVYDLKAFYNTRIGRIVRRVLRDRIAGFWPDSAQMRVMGYGYALPYMSAFMPDAERIFNVMPAGQGTHQWPVDGKNLTCLSEETELPLETNSVDRILMIHSLEYSEISKQTLQEVWRVLKSNGRMLLIVPNRAGLWARADWSPFGQGTPYSASQIVRYLKDNLFVHERTEEALFMPPFSSSIVMKSAGWFEYLGQSIVPFAAGVHMVEASKQLYARPGTPSGTKVRVRGRGLFGGTPSPEPALSRKKGYSHRPIADN